MKQLVIPTNTKIRIPGTEVYVLHHYGANILINYEFINYEVRENSEGSPAPVQQAAPDR